MHPYNIWNKKNLFHIKSFHIVLNKFISTPASKQTKPGKTLGGIKKEFPCCCIPLLQHGIYNIQPRSLEVLTIVIKDRKN